MEKYFVTAIAIALFALAATDCLSQDSSRMWSPESWKKFEPGFRLGVGTQKRFYLEPGLGIQKYYYNPRHGFMVVGYYAGYEWIPAGNDHRAVNGIKIGCELVNNCSAGAIEIKYQFSGDTHDVVITPKFGFGMGAVNLLYGYNFSTRKRPFPQIGKHQFSLVFNTSLIHHHARRRNKRS